MDFNKSYTEVKFKARGVSDEEEDYGYNQSWLKY